MNARKMQEEQKARWDRYYAEETPKVYREAEQILDAYGL